MNDQNEDFKNLNIRLTRQQWVDLESICKKNDRTVSGQLRRWIRGAAPKVSVTIDGETPGGANA